MSQNNSQISLIENIVKIEINRKEAQLQNEKAKYKCIKILLTLIFTYASAQIYYHYFRKTYISEIISYNNVPTYPLENLEICLNYDLGKNDDFIFLLGFFPNIKDFRKKNQVRKYGEIASIKQIKGEYNCFKADKSLKMKDIILKQGEALFIGLKVNEKNFKNLKDKYLYFSTNTYTINSKNEIKKNDIRFKHFFLEHEIPLSYKNNVVHIYCYDIYSNTLKNGTQTKNFSSISDNEIVRYFNIERDDNSGILDIIIGEIDILYERSDRLLKTVEVKSISFQEIFFMILGSVEFIIDIIPSIISFIRRKRNNSFELINQDRINLPLNEINNNSNAIIEELNNQNA